MPFFTRPDLSDIQFKQMSGSTLTMSGTTDFIGILKSKGVEIDASVTGATSATTGHVLTFLDGKIRLAPSTGGGGGGGNAFDSARPTTRSGIPIVNVNGATVQQFLEGYFFPSVPPSFSISGGGVRMFGNNSNFSLIWTVTRRTLPLTSVTVNGVSLAPAFFTGLTQNSSITQATVGLPTGATTGVINTPNTNQNYSVAATTASESPAADTTTVTFRHKNYAFRDNQDLLDGGLFTDAGRSTVVNLHEGDALPAGEAVFATSRNKATFTMSFANQFLYYIYPATYGNASFTINGLPNTDFTALNFTFTNPFGFPFTFRIYRSNNLLNGSFNIAVA